MDGPFKPVPRGRPWPCKNLLKVHPTAAEVVGENKLLPGLVVLYSVFGLGGKSREEVKWEIVCEKVSYRAAHSIRNNACLYFLKIKAGTFSSIQDSIEVLFRKITFIWKKSIKYQQSDAMHAELYFKPSTEIHEGHVPV